MNNIGVAKTTKTTFSRTTEISKFVNADLLTVWELLINGQDYPKWNSTVTFFEGEIGLGHTIKLKSYLDSKRVFKFKVNEFLSEERIVWGDSMGKRVIEVKSYNQGTLFRMKETIGGILFPLFASKIPDFDESFEKFANDLAHESEKQN